MGPFDTILYPQTSAFLDGVGSYGGTMPVAYVGVPVLAQGCNNNSSADTQLYAVWQRLGAVEALLRQLSQNPAQNQNASGAGLSNYDLWKQAGNSGTLNDFLASLKGAAGLGAYQLWLSRGNVGTEDQFLASLKASVPSTSTGLSTQQQTDLNQSLKSMLLIMSNDTSGSFTVPHGLDLGGKPLWCQVQTPQGRPDLNVGAVQEIGVDGVASTSLLRITVPNLEVFPAGSRIWVNVVRQSQTVSVSQ